ncbi:UNVERIFIED_CONTAM: Septum-promoting GTP-binding protein 1 [Sesamum calycinum]|uniref:Septum-promoting GTP-binding protein 1 n=1 Tax=Sesamum calycinum TaxID=2727403 RepID=A0AAW2Q3J0_9LAMI
MATQKSHDGATGKMTQLCRKILHINIRWSILQKVTVLRQFLRLIWHRILVCSTRYNFRYRRISSPRRNSSSPSTAAGDSGQEDPTTTSSCSGYDSDSDLVSLKISVLGDSQIGKTSFLVKYVGDEEDKRSLQMKGLNVMEKNNVYSRIAFRIWDVGGEKRSFDQVPIACKDAVAILFMFDLTSRCTLTSVVEWYRESRKWNQLPPDIQWTIVTQARAYARGLKATLFFSSAKHTINVNKIFKFIMAKLFNLPWTLHRNLTIGEPIIDF